MARYQKESSPASVVKSLQGGLINSSSPTTGTGEDNRYIDIPVSQVDPSKSIAFSDIGYSSAGVNAYYKSGSTNTHKTNIRLLNSSTLRVSVPSNDSFVFYGRWQLVEYA